MFSAEPEVGISEQKTKEKNVFLWLAAKYFLSLQPQKSTVDCRDGGMVDTRDLKSLDPEGLCGFESRSRHL